MNEAPPPLAPPAPFPHWKRWGLVVLWLVLGLHYVMPLTEVLAPTLDSSVHATYAHFTAHGFQFGSEVNTTAGPYGFVMFGYDYSGELFWARWFLILVFAGTLAALVLWFFRAARGGWARWCWLLALVSGLAAGDNRFNAAILLGGLYLLLNYDRAGRRLPVFLVAAFLAELSLMKGTQLAVAGAVILVVAALALLRRTWRDALWVLGSYGMALVGWWCAAGQNPLHLPAYVDGIRQIAAGYNEAMAVYEPPAIFWIGVALLLSLAALLLSTAWIRRTHPAMLAGLALLAGFTAVAWKHGYVRADGHVFVFLDLGCILALTVLVLDRIAAAPASRPARVATTGLAALALALGIVGAEQINRGRIRWILSLPGSQFADNFRFVTDPLGEKTARDVELFVARRTHRLPEVRRAVGDHSIDFYGHEMGRLLLNELNYAPAPMACGTYHVYNRHFKDLNVRHFSDPRLRPDFVLLKLQSIDYRFEPQDDSLSLLTLLHAYRPVLLEDGMALLAAIPGRTAPPAPRRLSTQTIRFDEVVAVPEVPADQLLLFSLDLPASWAGRAREVAYKPPPVFMDAEGLGLDAGRDRRLIPGSIAVPSLLTPAVENTADFVALVSGKAQKKILRFRLRTPAPGCFREDQLAVTFYTAPRPDVMPISEHYRFYAASVYSEAPAAIDPPNAPIDFYRKLRVQFLHPPAAVTFHLRGDERLVTFIGGIDEHAYTGGGRTDGVDFILELREPGESPRILSQRLLQPVSAPADRGTHLIRGILPPVLKPGSDLVLRTDPGPRHDASWDWAFATSIRIQHGNFTPEQFPRFNVLPLACDGRSVSPLNDGTRDLTVVAAPGGFTLPLRSTDNELTFVGGLLAGSYTRGETDGAAFFVDLELPDGTTQRIFAKHLRPKTVPADRGDQTCVVPLPPRPAGTRLHLRSDPGPAGDAAFDWVYVAGLHLR